MPARDTSHIVEPFRLVVQHKQKIRPKWGNSAYLLPKPHQKIINGSRIEVHVVHRQVSFKQYTLDFVFEVFRDLAAL